MQRRQSPNINLTQFRTTRSTLFFRDPSRTEVIAACLLFSGVGVAAILVGVGGRDWQNPDLLFFGGFLAVSILLSVRVPQGFFIGLTSMALISFALVLPYQLAALVCLGLMLLLAVARVTLQPLFGVPARYRLTTFIEHIGQAGLDAAGILLGGGTAQALTANQPDPPALLIFAIMVVVYMITREGLTFLRLRYISEQEEARRFYVRHSQLLFRQYVWVAIAPLIVLVYQERSDLRLLLFAVAVIVAVQIFNANRHHLRLHYRLDDLRRLNYMGQRLNSASTLDEVLEILRTSLGELLDVSSLYVGLVEEDHLYFPLMYEESQRIEPMRVPFGNSATEYIIKTRQTLVISGDLSRAVERLGLNVPTNRRRPRSYIGAPMIAGEEVIGVIGLRNYQHANIFANEDAYILEALATQVANAIQSVQNLARSRKQSMELSSVNAIAQTLTVNAEVAEVINAVCQTVIEVTSASKSAVFLLNPSGEEVELRGSIGLSVDYQREAANTDLKAVRHRAIRETDTLVIENIFTDERFTSLHALARQEGFSAVLEAPLSTADGILGSLAAYYVEPRQFTDNDLEIMSTLASHMAVAFTNARLFSDLNQRQRELEQLYAFTSSLTATLSINGVCETVASTTQTALEAQDVIVFITTESNRELEIRARAHSGTLTPLGQNADYPMLEMEPVAAFLRGDESVAVTRSDAHLLPGISAVFQGFGLAQLHLTPVRAHRDIIALIAAGYEIPTTLTDRRHRIVEAIAAQAAVALQNARLFEYTDVMLASRLQEIATLEDIVRRMTRRLDMYQIIEQVAIAAASATGAQHVEVALLDANGTTFETVIHYDGEQIRTDERTIDWPIDSGVVGRALRMQEVIFVDDVTTDEDYIHIRPGMQSELVAPILLDGRPLGVINLESPQFAAFTDEQADFIGNLAEHAAIAIQNARLFERLQQGRSEFRALRAIAIDLLRQGNLRKVLQTIARAAIDNTPAQNIHIYLYDSTTDTLTFGTGLGKDGTVDDEFAPPREDGLTARAARSGDTIIIHSPSEHPLTRIHAASPKWMPISGLMAIPLKRGDEVIGVFNVAFRESGAMTDDAQRFLGLLAVQASVAVTDTQLAEQTRTQRDQLESILESIQDGIVVMDNNGHIILTNARLGYLLNVRAADYEGRSYRALIDRIRLSEPTDEAFDADTIADLVESIRERPHEVTQRSYFLEKPDLRAIEETSVPVMNDQGKVFGRLFIVQDVTQQYELDQYRQNLSSMMVHDLRSPLSGVITGLNIALDEFQEDEMDMPTVKQVVNVAFNTANSMLHLVESILDVNKLEAGELAMLLKHINLLTIAERVKILLSTSSEAANIAIVIQHEGQVPDIVADKSLIERVLINLVDNAIRYTAESTTITIKIETADAYQTVTVTDEGMGIPDEYKDRIFDRFFQNPDQGSKRGSKGSGLGLNFAKLAVETHGGRIWVTDSQPTGSAFHFTIPTGLKPTTFEETDD